MISFKVRARPTEPTRSSSHFEQVAEGNWVDEYHNH